MKKYVLNNSINLIESVFPNYSEEELKTIRYGLEGIYITITKTIIIFSIAIMLNILKELIIIVLLYNFLRMFSFGLHANNSISCLLTSSLIFIGSSYICTIIAVSFNIKVVTSILCTMIFIKYSPADTKKRPIINKLRRLKYKIISNSIMIIYVFLLFYVDYKFLQNALLISMVMQSFLISPISYSLFKQPYDNFLYRKEGFNE
ncbi:MAG: accessory gene regulator B family protein [Bacilli bacterium]|nr:accessory gene regulator B family protein [Bacilli bacterium]MDD4282212.1 accessory gene regulator B family protein [Bacilli bacterium]MDD4718211.1 accessory gene regulator B family protein [Bacilli bacterium]